MSFLAPLYLAGLLGVSLPILLHLIRRSPEGRRVFSSLMFLTPSPPRLSRKSRLEHWLLLAVRALALILLAAAFGRPFLRSQAQLDLAGFRGRRVAMLIDTSASMRRPDVWRRALEQARQVLDALQPADRVGVIAFDERPRLLQSWAESEEQQDGAASVAQAKLVLEDLQPAWYGTDLGGALTFAADALVEANDRAQSDAAMQIVVISDLQQGARVEALQSFAWPENVQAAFHPIAGGGNASIRLAEVDAAFEDDAEAAASRFRLRLANSPDARAETYRVAWANASGPLSEDVAVSAPAGETRVVGMPPPPPGADRVVLQGDDADFDNTFYFAPTPEDELDVALWMDDDPEDPLQLRFYLEAALSNLPRRQVRFASFSPGGEANREQLDAADLVVTRDVLSEQAAGVLRDWLAAGGVALWVLAEPAESGPLQDRLRSVSGLDSLEIAEASPEPYRLLAEIDFQHPLFARLASPQYSDFTNVRFWGHRRLVSWSEACRVATRFDDGDVAVLEAPVGRGRLLVLAAGWRPEESQLARVASKFIPMMEGLASMARKEQWSPAAVAVGQTLPLPSSGNGAWDVAGPAVALADGERFVAVEPGLYQARRKGDGPQQVLPVAVNLAGDESLTAPRDPAELEPMGVRIGQQASQAEVAERARHLQDVELEGRQKLWQWALAAVFGLLIFETWLAARTARKALASSAAHPSS